ncbi:ZIP family metal transporter [Candidatus Endomicrobiellum agilis]|jgi:ZIP family zinc transporter/zinc and cadmium transporter|uniref:ZIP family metal transporter n=1 Tax=Candidatus Endomicrobiellum agilis TaxID=3238957 RepID=UPI002845F66D|nr:ZIP family metal transporter [Endomicrobium sp.]MDR3092877.1 ZIP family metal transporter [Endomicrobium sp.]
MEVIYSLIAASAAMLGALIVLAFHKWSEKNSFFIINFSAGVMLTLAFTHLIPEGMGLNPKTMVYVLLGFLIMFFLQFIVLFHPCHDDECSKHMGVTSIVGLSLHSMIDGLMIAVGFEVDNSIGILTAIAILLHKLPDGITISGILLHRGASKKRIFNFSLLTACFTPIGAILGRILFKNMSLPVLGSLLGLTAGSFIFLSASDLIPETHKCKNRFVPFMLFAGAIVILATEYIMSN